MAGTSHSMGCPHERHTGRVAGSLRKEVKAAGPAKSNGQNWKSPFHCIPVVRAVESKQGDTTVLNGIGQNHMSQQCVEEEIVLSFPQTREL